MSAACDVWCGDARELLSDLPDGLFDCCVTSPPYYGLRDYGTSAQTWGGSLDCTHEWIDTSYRDSRKTDTTAGDKQRTNNGAVGWRDALRQNSTCLRCGAWHGSLGLEPTPDLFVAHLVDVFREVRRALRSDGTLWLNIGDSYAANRGYQVPDSKHIDVGNNKSATVPPGCKSKDLIGIPWMLAFALRADGWWLRQDIIWHKPNVMPESVRDRCTKSHEYLFLLSKSERYHFDPVAMQEPAANAGKVVKLGSKSFSKGQATGAGVAASGNGLKDSYTVVPYRNRRSVWSITTQPFKGAHFATFPEALVEPCVLAGSRPGGVVLDPFCGSGRAGVVAKRLGRGFLGMDLNEKYCVMAREQLSRIGDRETE